MWSLNTPTRVAPWVLTAATDPVVPPDAVEPAPLLPPLVPVDPPVVAPPLATVPPGDAPGAVSPDPVVPPPVVAFDPGASVVFEPLLDADDTFLLLWWLTATAPTMAASKRTTEAVSRPSSTMA